jgi:protocatechuate 3,4-dioxygenase alpha subunit
VGPFFAITVFARGLLDRLFTRAYLPETADAPFLHEIAEDRRATLMARADERGFVFDIRLQGEGETVFLTFPRD